MLLLEIYFSLKNSTTFIVHTKSNCFRQGTCRNKVKVDENSWANYVRALSTSLQVSPAKKLKVRGYSCQSGLLIDGVWKSHFVI